MERLPAGIRQRFIECVAGRGMPKPLWTSLAPARERWVIFLWIGICSLLILALLGGNRHQEMGWLAAWVIAAVALGWGIFGWRRARRMKHALPFAPGIYVFATDVIIAEDAKCFQHDFDTLKHARLHPVTGAGGIQEVQIEWDFPGEMVPVRVPSQQIAQRLLGQIQMVRDRLAQAMAASAWDNVMALDPLYEARYGGGWEQMCPPVVLSGARGESGWFGLPVPVVRAGMLGGIVAGAAFWFGLNLVRDSMAFQSAQSVNTPATWRQFLKRPDSSYHAEVRRRSLPEAELHMAMKDGGNAEALRNVIIEFADSTAAGEARTALEQMYAQAESRALAEVEPSARPAVQGMFRWLREHGSSDVEVRFGESFEALMTTIDEDLKQLLLLERKPIDLAPSAASFSSAVAHRREDAVVSVLRQGFQKFASSDLVNLRKGQVFSGEPLGFQKPTIAIQPVVKPILELITDRAQQRAYLTLGFNFQVALTVPGVPAWKAEFPVSPCDFLDATQSGSLYDRMADIAYQELHQKLAATFFPHHAPERAIKLTPTRATTAPVAAPSAGTTYSATGFFISPQGYLVTARHVTRDARNIRVITESGPLPARLVREDDANDLALLKVEGSFKALPIRPSGTVKRLDKVATYGFPQINIQGRDLKATDGTISGLKGQEDNASVFQISVPLQHGNSGGPLLDDRGNVIGVVVSGLNPSRAQNVNYAVKSDELLKFLATFPELKNLPPPVASPSPGMSELIEQATVRLEGN